MPDQLTGPIGNGDMLLWVAPDGESSVAVQVVAVIDRLGAPCKEYRLRGFKTPDTAWSRDVPEDHLRRNCRRYA